MLEVERAAAPALEEAPLSLAFDDGGGDNNGTPDRPLRSLDPEPAHMASPVMVFSSAA